MFSVLVVLMAGLRRSGDDESATDNDAEAAVRRPRLATTCPLCTLETRVGANVKTGDHAICIRCDRRFTVGETYSAAKQPNASTSPRPLPSSPAASESSKRPARCTRCRMGLLPKESRCSYCGLNVSDMIIVEQAIESDDSEAADHRGSRRAVSSELRAGTGRSYMLELTVDDRDQVAAVAVRRDSAVIAACGQVGNLTLFSSKDGRSLAPTRQLDLPKNSIVYTAAFLPDHQLVVGGQRTPWLALARRSLLGIWSPTTGQMVQQLDPSCGAISEVAVQSDGRIAAMGVDGWVEVFEPGTASAQHRFQVRASRVVQRNGRRPIARFSADGRYLACCRGGTACLWDVSDGSHIGDYKTVEHRQLLGRVHRVLQAAAPASDGSRILLGAGGKGGGWFRMPAATAHRSVLTSLFDLNFQPMGTKWRELGELSVWRTNSDEVEGVLSSNDKDEFDAVMDVAFLQDDTHVASLTADGSVVFWVVGEPRPTQREGLTYMFSRLNVAPNGRFVVTQQSANTLKLYRTPWKTAVPIAGAT